MESDGSEKRKSSRTPFPCRITVSSPVRMISSHTEDIGPGGLRVMLDERLSMYTTLGLEIFLEQDKPIKCKGKVVWVRENMNPIERQPTIYETGIKFVEMNDCDQEYINILVDFINSKKKE